MGLSNVLTRPIYPKPVRTDWKTGEYEFGSNMTLYCHAEDVLQLQTMRELWNNFTMGTGTLYVRQSDIIPRFCAVISHKDPTAVRQLKGDFEYTVNVTDGGFELAASDSIGLIHAFFSTLQLFHARCLDEGNEQFAAPHGFIQDRPEVGFRGIHLCVFPETSLLLLEKAIKLAGFMKLTHVVLEFWGTLQFDVMPELYWKDRFYTKDEIRPLIHMANGMGMQVIPMFNHLGHAAASRVRYGRHVVLNQNPKHAMLFEPDGWTWCLSNTQTRDLLKSIRQELIDLCGSGDYFFIGCDEAYSFATCDLCHGRDAAKMLIEYINDVSDEMKAGGRRVVMWGDELLRKDEWKAPYFASGTVIPNSLSMLSRDVIVADWQYGVKDSNMATSKHLMDQGFDTLLCPWDKRENIKGLTEAAKKLNAFGVLATTWNHLPQYIRIIPQSATMMWSESFRQVPSSTAGGIIRKLVLTDKYEDAGWNAREVDY